MPRINRAIELLEAGQPIYYDTVRKLSHEHGVEQAQTWADYLNFELEHHPFAPESLTPSCAAWSRAGRPGVAIAPRP
jgi:hypothetical protein